MKDISMKICILGDAAVGKTTIIHKYCTGEFIDSYEATLGAGFLEHEINGEIIDSKYKGYKIHLNIYDIAAQTSYNFLLDMYTTGLHGYFLAFSVDNPVSLDNIEKWKEKITELNPEIADVPYIIIGTKEDIQSQVPKEKIEETEKKFNKKIIMTSSKADKNVNNVFNTLTKMILDEFDDL